VIDGPFAETKELLAGFWLIQVPSPEEAIAWGMRCPVPDDAATELGIRQVFEAEDCGPALTPELREQEERLRAQIKAQGEWWRTVTGTDNLERTKDGHENFCESPGTGSAEVHGVFYETPVHIQPAIHRRDGRLHGSGCGQLRHALDP
jgi:YCII-related domain